MNVVRRLKEVLFCLYFCNVILCRSGEILKHLTQLDRYPYISVKSFAPWVFLAFLNFMVSGFDLYWHYHEGSGRELKRTQTHCF